MPCSVGQVCSAGACVTAPDAGGGCVYTCSVDVASTTTDCAGAITGAFGVGLNRDRFTATVDMGGLTELTLSVTICDPTGFTVHVADSPTCDGFGGDAATSSNDAEVQLSGTTLGVYANQNASPPSMLLYSDAAFVAASGCTMFTWTVRDQFFGADVGSVSEASPYLLRIDPPTDTEGVPDALWYVGLNRSYGSTARSGTGVSTATLCVR